MVRYRPDVVQVTVTDDGKPAGQAGEGTSGHGLAGMRERLALYGGDLQAGQQPGGGYQLAASLPLHEGRVTGGGEPAHGQLP